MADIQWNNLQAVLEKYVEFFIEEAQKNIDDYGAVATGNMRNITPNAINIKDDYISVTVNIEDYFKYVEGGSKGLVTSPPNAVYKAHKPPVQAILDWIDAKGLSKGNEKDDLGFAIATTYSILNRGLEPKPFFQDAKEVAYKKFEKDINEAIKKDVQKYIEDSINYIK